MTEEFRNLYEEEKEVPTYEEVEILTPEFRDLYDA